MDELPLNCHEIEIEVRLGVVLGILGLMRFGNLGLSRDAKYLILRVYCEL